VQPLGQSVYPLRQLHTPPWQVSLVPQDVPSGSTGFVHALPLHTPAVWQASSAVHGLQLEPQCCVSSVVSQQPPAQFV
jgi:hypothetical protein